MASCDKILLVGFAGAGKSTLLQELKKSPPTGWELFDDLDGLILESSSWGSVASLVKKEGWEYFRQCERDTLITWTRMEGPGVLALGGGAFSPDLLSREGVKLCLLDVSFETCWKRIQGTEEERPLMKQGRVGMKKLYDERYKLFKEIPWKIDAEQKPFELVKNFWSTLKLSYK